MMGQTAISLAPFGGEGRGEGERWKPRTLAAIATLVTLPLTACGFHPLYGSIGPNGAGGPELRSIYVEPISDRTGYELRNSLLDLLNSDGPQTSRYFLKLYLAEREDAVVLQSNTSITRYSITLSAHYDLLPRGDTAPIKSGDLISFAAYNVAAAPFLYATATAKRDAQNRAANDIAERLRTELAVYLREQALANAAPAAPPVR